MSEFMYLLIGDSRCTREYFTSIVIHLADKLDQPQAIEFI